MEQKPPIQNNTEDVNKKEKISSLERVKEKGQKFLKRLRQTSLILSVGFAAHYTSVHSNEVKETSKDKFEHSDPETTHILNYLAGEDSLTHEEQMNLLKADWKAALEKKGEVLPENFDSMSDDEYFSFLKNIDQKNGISRTLVSEKQNTDNFFEKNFPKKHDRNDSLYRIIWETEKECGSPKIRWTAGHERNAFKMSSESGEAHYNALTHTISLHPWDFKLNASLNDLTAEWSHSKQVSDNYMSSLVGEVESLARIAEDVLKTHDVVKSQLKEYHIKGSIENEAHTIIQPYLRNKFNGVAGIQLKK